MLAVRAEMAERLGEDHAAENALQAALTISPDDPYLKASYADVLLRQHRSGEVLVLLAGAEAQDSLLLRLAIAGHQARAPQASHWARLYEERIEAAARDNDFTHRREQALFLLEVTGDVAGGPRGGGGQLGRAARAG